MDPKQVPPVGVNSGSVGSSATGSPVFANPANRFRGENAQNRFRDTDPKGDIIIPPSGSTGSDNSKKPLNKKIIIGAIVAVVVVVVVVILVAVFSGGGKKSSGSQTSSAGSSSVSTIGDVQTAFNKYANFIISGEASPERMPSRDELDGYLIVQKIIDKDTEFMDEAKGLFDDFYDSFENAREDQNYVFNDRVEAYKKTFDFLYEYSKPDAKIEDFSSMTENGLAVSYANAKIAYDNSVAARDNVDKTKELRDAVNAILDSAETDVMYGCYTIDEILYGEVEYGDVVEDEE